MSPGPEGKGEADRSIAGVGHHQRCDRSGDGSVDKAGEYRTAAQRDSADHGCRRLASAPDNVEVVAGGQAATRTTQAPVLLPDRKETKPAGPEVRIFRLFNKNTNMREERASVILLVAMHNEPIPLKEVGHVSGIASERLPSLVNRLRKEGWLERSGRGKYQMGKFAITDTVMDYDLNFPCSPTENDVVAVKAVHQSVGG